MKFMVFSAIAGFLLHGTYCVYKWYKQPTTDVTTTDLIDFVALSTSLSIGAGFLLFLISCLLFMIYTLLTQYLMSLHVKVNAEDVRLKDEVTVTVNFKSVFPVSFTEQDTKSLVILASRAHRNNFPKEFYREYQPINSKFAFSSVKSGSFEFKVRVPDKINGLTIIRDNQDRYFSTRVPLFGNPSFKVRIPEEDLRISLGVEVSKFGFNFREWN